MAAGRCSTAIRAALNLAHFGCIAGEIAQPAPGSGRRRITRCAGNVCPRDDRRDDCGTIPGRVIADTGYNFAACLDDRGRETIDDIPG